MSFDIGVTTVVCFSLFLFCFVLLFCCLFSGILEWLETGKGTWMGFLTRETMETAQSYDEAQKMLANTLMMAPAYYILGGTRPGQVR